MSKAIFQYTKSFDESTIEWNVSGNVLSTPGTPINFLLMKFWISTDIIDLNKQGKDLELYPEESDIQEIMDSSIGGSSFVRALLPSEILDYPTKSELIDDLTDRAKSYILNEGTHKPFSGYFFYRDNTVSEGYINYDQMVSTINSIEAVAKSYSKEYPALDNTDYPVNSRIYYTFPDRLVEGGLSVYGCKAGDIIKFSSTGGSGEYEVSVDPASNSSLVDIYRGTIRVVKNSAGLVKVIIKDKNDTAGEFSTISINIEEV